jgi:hypothetical protein
MCIPSPGSLDLNLIGDLLSNTCVSWRFNSRREVEDGNVARYKQEDG